MVVGGGGGCYEQKFAVCYLWYVITNQSTAYHCELCLCSIKTSPVMLSLRSEGMVPRV